MLKASMGFGQKLQKWDECDESLKSFAHMTEFARRKDAAGAVAHPMVLNGAPAARIDIDGVLDAAISVVVEGGKITHIFAIRNPHKLTRHVEETQLSRVR